MFKKIKLNVTARIVGVLSSLAILLGSSVTMQAQTTITGTVVDPSGLAVIGASVFVTGTQNGTVTDENGRYSLPNVETNAILQY